MHKVMSGNWCPLYFNESQWNVDDMMAYSQIVHTLATGGLHWGRVLGLLSVLLNPSQTLHFTLLFKQPPKRAESDSGWFIKSLPQLIKQ